MKPCYTSEDQDLPVRPAALHFAEISTAATGRAFACNDMTEETKTRLRKEAIELNGGRCAECGHVGEEMTVDELADPVDYEMTEDVYRANCMPVCRDCLNRRDCEQ